MSGPSSLAIIPARGGSKRVAGKNIRSFFGRPIVEYIIETALRSNCFTDVMVSTDDERIARISRDSGASVPFMRSAENSADLAGLAAVAEEVLREYRKIGRTFELFCCLLPTAVFVTTELLGKCKVLMMNEDADAVLPVVRFSYPIARALQLLEGRLQMIHPEFYSIRSQDLEPAYHDAGQFYWIRAESFLKQRKFFCDNMRGIEVPESCVQDIDSEEDWRIAEIKYSLMRGERQE